LRRRLAAVAVLDRIEAEITSLEAEMERLRQWRRKLNRLHHDICQGDVDATDALRTALAAAG